VRGDDDALDVVALREIGRGFAQVVARGAPAEFGCHAEIEEDEGVGGGVDEEVARGNVVVGDAVGVVQVVDCLGGGLVASCC